MMEYQHVYHEEAEMQSVEDLAFGLDRTKDMNIVLIGRSGVGKSTWINSFFNYLLHPSFDSAVREGPVYAPVYSRFKHYHAEADDVVNKEDDDDDDDDGFGCLVDIEIGDKHQENINQEYREGNTGVSATMFPMAHRLEPKDEKYSITLIDTPGFCSTAPGGDTTLSEAQDKQNINLILNQLGQYPHINAFVILLKPGQEKLDPGFATSLKTLFSQLDESAKSNVIFSFTHSKNCDFNDIQHLPALKNLLKSKANLRIKRSNVFYFDNSPFCYLATAANNYQPTDSRSKMQDCWDKSVKNCLNMLGHINQLPAHKTDTIIAINDSKSIIKMMIAPLVYVCKINEENYALVNQTYDNLAKQTGRSVIKVKDDPKKNQGGADEEIKDENAHLNLEGAKAIEEEEKPLIQETNIDEEDREEKGEGAEDQEAETRKGGDREPEDREGGGKEDGGRKEGCGGALDGMDLIEINEKILIYKKLRKPITVCNNPACFKKQSILEGKDIVKKMYHNVCCHNCLVPFVSHDKPGSLMLLLCKAFDWSLKCRKCDHSKDEHIHIAYELNEAHKVFELEIKDINQRKKDLELEFEVIIDILVFFAQFLNHHCLLKEEMLVEQCIDRELVKVSQDLGDLVRLQDECQEEVKELSENDLVKLQATIKQNEDELKAIDEKISLVTKMGKLKVETLGQIDEFEKIAMEIELNELASKRKRLLSSSEKSLDQEEFCQVYEKRRSKYVSLLQALRENENLLLQLIELNESCDKMKMLAKGLKKIQQKYSDKMQNQKHSLVPESVNAKIIMLTRLPHNGHIFKKIHEELNKSKTEGLIQDKVYKMEEQLQNLPRRTYQKIKKAAENVYHSLQ
ncbi:interaptin-like isoform X2 [Clytia hemisphaerica]|uniref:DUF8206 domain-containing protein n=1 Tax=Clytia hemisphaerica TaxID=252671 RepID=A0A7M5X1A0_9CNID